MIPFNITRDFSNCPSLEFNNTSLSTSLTYEVSIYEGGIYEVTPIIGTISANSSIKLNFLADGIYSIKVTMAGQPDEYRIFIQDCAISTCKMKYLDAILKCKETACIEDCLGNEKLYYNALVVFELSNLYEVLLDSIFVQQSYDAPHVITPYQLSQYANIELLLERISKYCIDCIKPCKNC